MAPAPMGRAMAPAPPHGALREAVEVSLRVMAFSVVGVLGGLVLFWVPTRTFARSDFGDIGMDHLAAGRAVNFTVDAQVLDQRFGIDFSQTPPRVYHTLASLLYFRMSRIRAAMLFAGTAAFNVATILLTVHFWDLRKIFFPLPMVGGTILVILLVPLNRVILKAIILQLFAVILLVVFTSVLSSLPPSSDTNRVILACLVTPVLKEGVFSVGRYSARKLALARCSGAGVRRHFAWLFLLWTQLSMAMLTRLLLSSFRSGFWLTVSVLLQSVVELASRLTLDLRDSAAKRCFRALAERSQRSVISGPASSYVGRRGSVLVVPVSFIPADVRELAKSERSHRERVSSESDDERPGTDVLGDAESTAAEDELVVIGGRFASMAHHSVTSAIIVFEMLSEYVAILMVPWLLLLFSDRRLAVPFDYYVSVESPFADKPIDIASVLLASGIQLVSELAVDIVCCYLENRRGYRLLSVWRDTTPWLALQVAMATWLSSSGLFVVVAFGDDVSPCLNTDYCLCRDGLLQGGYRNLYCQSRGFD